MAYARVAVGVVAAGGDTVQEAASRVEQVTPAGCPSLVVPDRLVHIGDGRESEVRAVVDGRCDADRGRLAVNLVTADRPHRGAVAGDIADAAEAAVQQTWTLSAYHCPSGCGLHEVRYLSS